MAWGSWVLRAGVYSMIFTSLYAVTNIFPTFIPTVASAIFGTASNPTVAWLEVYGIFFVVGTIIVFAAEHSILHSRDDEEE